MAIASPVGEIILYAKSTSIVGTVEVISGWLLCNGASVSKTSYSDLWNIFSQNDTVVSPWDLGAPDATTFRLPNLLGRIPLGVSGGHALGTTGGAETVTLSSVEIPSHSHAGGTTSTLGAHTHGAATSGSFSANHTHTSSYLYYTFWQTAASGGTIRDIYEYNHASSDDELMTTDSVGHNHAVTSPALGNHSHVVTVNNTGSGAAHNNLPPYITMAYVIKY